MEHVEGSKTNQKRIGGKNRTTFTVFIYEFKGGKGGLRVVGWLVEEGCACGALMGVVPGGW